MTIDLLPRLAYKHLLAIRPGSGTTRARAGARAVPNANLPSRGWR
jgi:hypothetical protein